MEGSSSSDQQTEKVPAPTPSKSTVMVTLLILMG